MDMEKIRAVVAEKSVRSNILVVGDVMLDKYYTGEVTRISPEAPVPITHVTGTRETLGGAANVAHNLALLGTNVSIAGYVGDDAHCKSLLDKFAARGIDYSGLVHTDRPTTTKIRIIGGHQQMLRLDFEDASPVTGDDAKAYLAYIDKKLNESMDCVIISDYGKGACTEFACQYIIRAAHDHGVPVIVDPKGAQWVKYKDADYITPNLKEINEILLEPIANEDFEIEKAARYAIRKFGIRNIVLTRSSKGLSLVHGEEVVHIPTRAQEVFDVSGAGDTVIAVFGLALAGGLKPAVGAYLANIAASVVVSKLGTYAVSREELLQELDAQKGAAL
ncbi:D-glycero-beta-D-manno-heptose-7-phosphate kinase [uncultured Selenomonas sp.]|uniref:D-glycero-beta-D-manno-heptose-7-phosphate kinase n=1 Tax=uncultured Selenomonas sp. TaxID=159275 RepID=UPI0028D74AB6|nr:D-glycero-beta-D-manno-heptose-7-phosphate kinase [uncultured Selenomonas sp.]